ncbi:hypothetical protein RFI_10558 [Reticulomyxa filosa]|uniref:Uncharacterized protein n=1 Tax=Reticulomyxa filosa TaxID=46433 RepID=X6NKY0_RETFI|nr:hypothetical protein RFI_10558 [Reticulomyxa filosa]|eukprot:ETO26578.1 hypothetical protein RFI_10558 [Reticulomyxa filosa]
MGLICVSLWVTTSKVALLILIAVFGFFIELHLQTSQRLSQNEFQPLVIEYNKSSNKKVMLNYLMELESALGPLFVSAFGGPTVYFCHKDFKYIIILLMCVAMLVELHNCEQVKEGREEVKILFLRNSFAKTEKQYWKKFCCRTNREEVCPVYKKKKINFFPFSHFCLFLMNLYY